MSSRQRSGRKAAERAIRAGQLTLPLDLDQLAHTTGATISLEKHIPNVSGYRDGNEVVMRADLSRSQQRLLGAHEIGHVAINSADVRRLETEDGYFLGGEEKEVDEFRNEIVLPRHRLVEMMEQGYTQEEMCWETGLEPDQLLKIYTDQVKSVYRRDL